MSSTRTLVTLLRPWIRRFTIIVCAWWLRTSSKFTWEEVKTSTGKLGKWSTPTRVRICPKHSAPLLSRDRRIKIHQSINQRQTNVEETGLRETIIRVEAQNKTYWDTPTQYAVGLWYWYKPKARQQFLQHMRLHFRVTELVQCSLFVNRSWHQELGFRLYCRSSCFSQWRCGS